MVVFGFVVMTNCETVGFILRWKSYIVVAFMLLPTFKNEFTIASILTSPNTYNIEKKHLKQIINLGGKPGEGYYVTILIGTPPQKLRVLIDTGSSNFAVAAYNISENTSFFNSTKSSTLHLYNVSVEVPYTQGNWLGSLGSDIIEFVDEQHNTTTTQKLPPILSKLSLIEKSENFFIQTAPWEGILGLAYPRLAKPYSSILSPFDQYIVDGYLDDIFSMQLCFNLKHPTKKYHNQLSGSLIFGGIEESMYTGEIFYTPIIRRWYYEVIMTSIKVDNHSLPLDCITYNKERTIIDTGTTNLRLEQQAFISLIEQLKKYQKLGDIPDDFWYGKQYMCWEKSTFAYVYLPTIQLSLLSTMGAYHDFQLHITPQMYLREIVDNFMEDGQSCYRFAISSSEKTTVIGAIILEGFYVIFDRENDRIGFAVTNCGDNGKKNFRSDITGPTLHDHNLQNCFKSSDLNFTQSQLSYIVFTMLTVMIITSLPLILYLIIELNPKNTELI